MSDWLKHAQGTIRRLTRELSEPNWDSYGAAPVAPNSAREAMLVVEQLARFERIHEPGVSVAPDGFIALGWDTGEWSMDAEVEPGGCIDWTYLARGDEQDGNQGVCANGQEFALRVDRLFGGKEKQL